MSCASTLRSHMSQGRTAGTSYLLHVLHDTVKWSTSPLTWHLSSLSSQFAEGCADLQLAEMQHFSCNFSATGGSLLSPGAGDLFASGFLAAWLAGRPLQDCARLGCLAGAAVLQARPPWQHCDWHESSGHHAAARTCVCASFGTRSGSCAGTRPLATRLSTYTMAMHCSSLIPV